MRELIALTILQRLSRDSADTTETLQRLHGDIVETLQRFYIKTLQRLHIDSAETLQLSYADSTETPPRLSRDFTETRQRLHRDSPETVQKFHRDFVIPTCKSMFVGCPGFGFGRLFQPLVSPKRNRLVSAWGIVRTLNWQSLRVALAIDEHPNRDAYS